MNNTTRKKTISTSTRPPLAPRPVPNSESIRSNIKRTLLGPAGTTNWGKQQELEKALDAIEAIQAVAKTYQETQLETHYLDMRFSEELMLLRQQFETIKRDVGVNKLVSKLESTPEEEEEEEERYIRYVTGDRNMSEAKVREVDKLEEMHANENGNENQRGTDAVDYEIPREFLERLNQMMDNKASDKR